MRKKKRKAFIKLVSVIMLCFPIGVTANDSLVVRDVQSTEQSYKVSNPPVNSISNYTNRRPGPIKLTIINRPQAKAVSLVKKKEQKMVVTNQLGPNEESGEQNVSPASNSEEKSIVNNFGLHTLLTGTGFALVAGVAFVLVKKILLNIATNFIKDTLGKSYKGKQNIPNYPKEMITVDFDSERQDWDMERRKLQKEVANLKTIQEKSRIRSSNSKDIYKKIARTPDGYIEEKLLEVQEIIRGLKSNPEELLLPSGVFAGVFKGMKPLRSVLLVGAFIAAGLNLNTTFDPLSREQ